MKYLKYIAVFVVLSFVVTAWAASTQKGAMGLTFDGANLLVSLATALSSTTDSVEAVREKASTASEGQTSCASTDTSLIASNANRIRAVIVNQSAVPVYISYSATATTANGIRLEENMSITEDHYTGEISCITASGTATVGRKEI